jgi:pimeloyl-ACP methyl ester carboxylesterase
MYGTIEQGQQRAGTMRSTTRSFQWDWRGFLVGCGVLLAFAGTSPGGGLRAAEVPPPPIGEMAVDPVPQCCRDHVHIYFIEGLDFFDYGQLRVLQAYCHSLGFRNAHYGQMWEAHDFAEEIRHLRATDPHARFVIVGYSFGSNVARLMANSLWRKNDLGVDLLIYLGGNTIKNKPESYPPNVFKVVHILATGYVWKGEPLDRADNYKLLDCWHFGHPTHPATRRVFARELNAVAARVPVVEPIAAPAQPLRSIQVMPAQTALRKSR